MVPREATLYFAERDRSYRYRVLRTALIQLEQAAVAQLDSYKDLINRYATCNGHSIWMIIYQADRLEEIQRIHLKELVHFGMGGSTSGFDPKFPWHAVCNWPAMMLHSGGVSWSMLVLAQGSSLHSMMVADVRQYS